MFVRHKCSPLAILLFTEKALVLGSIFSSVISIFSIIAMISFYFSYKMNVNFWISFLLCLVNFDWGILRQEDFPYTCIAFPSYFISTAKGYVHKCIYTILNYILYTHQKITIYFTWRVLLWTFLHTCPLITI